MKKKLFFVGLCSVIYCMPTFGQAITTQTNEIIEAQDNNYESLPANFAEVLKSVEDTKLKYVAASSVNMRQNPSTESEIFSVMSRNTIADVLCEIDGWTLCISPDYGYYFVKSEYLSDTPVSERSYTNEDLYILAHVLAGECQTYPDDEQRYVGSVVLNRVASSKFPNTIKGVVFQKGQYACTWDGNYYRTPTERNWANAKWLLENGSVLPEYVVFQSGGRQGRHTYLKTKYHYYCY